MISPNNRNPQEPKRTQNMTHQDTTFIKSISAYNWLDVNKTAKKRVMDIFTSRGLVKEYIDVCYGELDLLTALKMIK